MKVKFIFPPFSRSSLNGPYLAPFMLSALLNSKKINSEVVDLNIQMIRELLSEKIMLQILKKVTEPSDKKFIETYLKRDKLKFFVWNPEHFQSLLGVIRKYCFFSSQNFRESFRKKNMHHQIIADIYRELIFKNKLHKTDIICISIAFPEQFPEAVLLSKYIRLSDKSCKIIAGGCQINMMEKKDLEFISKQGVFDSIAQGNFDADIAELINDIRKNKFKKIIHARSEKCCATDTFPVIDFGNTDLYFSPQIFPVLVSKGCWWGKCVFCDYRRLNEKYSERSPEEVFADISFIRKKYPDAFIFLVSDAVSSAWYTKICKIAIKESLKISTWSYMIHSKKLNAGFFKLLAEAGVKRITFGTESTISKVLSSMNKNFSFEIIAENLKNAAAAGISNTVNIIPDFPGTTFVEAEQNIKNLTAIFESISMLNVQSFVLNARTEISQRPADFHIQVHGDADLSLRGFHGLKYNEKNGMSDAEKKRIMEDLNILSGKIQLRPVLKRIFSKLNNESILLFNPVVFDPSGDKPGMLNLLNNSVYLTRKWEYAIFKELFCEGREDISLAYLSTLFNKHNKISKASFSGWFMKLVSHLIISDIRN